MILFLHGRWQRAPTTECDNLVNLRNGSNLKMIAVTLHRVASPKDPPLNSRLLEHPIHMWGV